MIIAEVLSPVVSSARVEGLPPRALFSVKPLPGFGDPTPLIAIDTVSAQPGDLVLILQEGSGARQAALEDPSAPMPAQAAIVGIVDSL